MNFLKRIADGIDAVNERVGRFVSWVTALLVLVVFADVVMRYTMDISFVFTQELEWHIFGFIFLMGAGYTLLHEGHVRVDIVYQRLSAKGKAWVNLIGCLVFMAPGCLLIIITSWGFTVTSFNMMEGSPDPGGIPMRFLLKGCIPVGFFLLGLQGISLFIRSLFIVTGREEPPAEKGEEA